MLTLSSAQIYLLKTVIDAAKNGQYCHGNGADWVITDPERTLVQHINHVTGSVSWMSKEDSARYMASTRPYTDLGVAESLTAFIKSE